MLVTKSSQLFIVRFVFMLVTKNTNFGNGDINFFNFLFLPIYIFLEKNLKNQWFLIVSSFFRNFYIKMKCRVHPGKFVKDARYIPASSPYKKYIKYTSSLTSLHRILFAKSVKPLVVELVASLT